LRLGRERRSSRRRRARAQSRRRNKVIISIAIVIPLLVAGSMAAVSLLGLKTVASVQEAIPSLEAQGSINLAQTTEIYASDGTLLAYLHDLSLIRI